MSILNLTALDLKFGINRINLQINGKIKDSKH